ncbi:MAG: N-acetyl-D-Glu racemase DgcA [Rubricella sp.]
MKLTVAEDRFPLREVFTISRGSRTEAAVVSVTLRDGEATGRGECVPYARYGESVESVMAQIMALDGAITTRAALQAQLPPGAARNALDTALWDLEAKRIGQPAWRLARQGEPKPVITAYTLSLAAPEAMREAAARAATRPLLKIKLGGGEEDMARIEAVREGAPRARIIVDANEGWSVEEYTALAPALVRLGVAMVEQPLPAGQDEALAEIARPLPVCADESAHDRSGLAALAGRYDMINIKLDKTGGLTEALALRDEARKAGLSVMVGCMVGSSLAMAPAHLVAQGAEIADLDGPLLLAQDRDPPIRFEGSVMHPPEAALWG